MSPRRLLVLFAAIFLAPLSAGSRAAQAPSPSEARAQLSQIEQRWLSHENDPQVLESILAGDFVHVVSVGMITKAEHIDYVRRHPFNDASRHFGDLRVRIYGSVGIVNGIVVAKSASGQLRKSAFTDVFAYRKGKWQAVNAQELPVTSPE